MYTSILNTIDDSDKQLGFLFTKRENTHLIQLCEYFDERLHDQIQPVDIAEIDARCTEGTSTIANNKRILWKALKDWAQLLGAPLPVMQKMGAMIGALNIPVAEEIAAKPRNLALAKVQAKHLLEDAEIGNEDLEAITLTIKHLLLPPNELQPIWAETAGPHYSDWINNIDQQEVHWENVIKVSRYGLLIALCNLDTNTTAMEHFHKVVNQRQHRKNEDLIPFYLWLGFKSFTARPIYWWVDCEYGKVKASGVDLNSCRAYIFGGFIIFKTYYNGLMIQPNEIKDLAQGQRHASRSSILTQRFHRSTRNRKNHRGTIVRGHPQRIGDPQKRTPRRSGSHRIGGRLFGSNRHENRRHHQPSHGWGFVHRRGLQFGTPRQ